MRLIIDIGNTRSKFAVFKGDDIIENGVILNRYNSGIFKKLINTNQISMAILSNTSDIDKTLLSDLYSLQHFVHLNHKTSIPITNLYETPETLGKDRIASAVGAYKKFPQSNCLIIDMGTCITTNFLSAKGEFIGGNISPGINMRLKAMHQFTAHLPLVTVGVNTEDFGTTTVKALQNGGVKGAIREIESLIDEVKIKLGRINVILTGGDAHYFENWTKNEIFVSPNLVLEGLNEILKYNVE